MTTEQILIRMGVDAKAVVVGLNQVSSYVKGWSTGLAATIKNSFGRLFLPALAASAFISTLYRVKEQIMEIKRVSQSTSFGTNFIQGFFNKLTVSGFDYRKSVESMTEISTIVGDVKRGSVDATSKLVDLLNVSRHTNFANYTGEQFVKDLAAQYSKLNTQEEKNSLLQSLQLKNWQALIPILRGGAAAIDDLNKPNFFTKFTPETIDNSSSAWARFQMTAKMVGITIANIAGLNSRSYSRGFEAVKLFGEGHLLQAGAEAISSILNTKEATLAVQNKINEAANSFSETSNENFRIEQQKKEVLQQQSELLLRQQELSGEVADRNKTSIQEMAAHARKYLGIIDPQRLNFTVSQRDRMALNIDQKEKQAQVAFERGDDRTAQRLTSEALQLRRGFSAASFKDREPMLKTEIELQKVNLQLAPVARMAEFVNQEHKAPK